MLVVEDSEHVRYFATQLLSELGCDVIEASNAIEALDRMKENEVMLVFSDIIMPGISGLDLVKKILETYGEIPVLLASGYSSKQFIRRTILPGISAR